MKLKTEKIDMSLLSKKIKNSNIFQEKQRK